MVLQGVECREADVVAFFGDAPAETRVELAGRAVAIGVAGLRAMGVAGHVELVEREFAKLSHQFDRALATTEGQLLERVHSTFDPERAESVSARLAGSVADAHGLCTFVQADICTCRFHYPARKRCCQSV